MIKHVEYIVKFKVTAMCIHWNAVSGVTVDNLDYVDVS